MPHCACGGAIHTGEFIIGEITTLLLLTMSIFKALAAPKFKVDYRAWLKKRNEFPESIFSIWAEVKLLISPAHLVVESEAVRFLHLEQVIDLGSVSDLTRTAVEPRTAALGIASVAQVMPA